MDLKSLIQQTRSYRRFEQNVVIPAKQIEQWIELARYAACSRNSQAVRFIIIDNPKINENIFTHLRWAGYLKDWGGPKEGERPAAYVLVLEDKKNACMFDVDAGIAMQNVLLGATSCGFGGCIIKSFNKKEITNEINFSDKYELQYVIALGKPAEKVIIEDVKNGDIKYYRDEQDNHIVPKRKLDELLIKVVF